MGRAGRLGGALARLDLPMRTTRLTLRVGDGADAARITALVQDPRVAGPIGGFPSPYRLEDARRFLRGKRVEGARGESLLLFLCRHANSEILGAVELHEFHALDRHASLGYWLGRPYWGQGLMIEAARTVVAAGFQHLGLHRVEACTLATNVRSLRVLEKVGFRREGRARKHRHVAGRWVDEVRLGLLAREFVAADADA